MNYEDEPYVRMYTRKTLTSRLLGWEGRAVQQAMLNGEFDAAGIFAIEGDAAECISVVTELPLEIVRVGLERLIKTKTWVVTAKTITWPTYEEAQNCMRSDRLRQRASRKARAERSVTDVTPSRQPVTDVTSGHAESRDVTLPPSAPSHPPSLPSSQEREDARAPDELPEVPHLLRVGVARTYTMPTETPPKAYIDMAIMNAVSREQAVSTWKHYWGAGLPPGGVEKLHPWLCDRAKDRANQLAKAPKSGPRTAPDDGPPQWDRRNIDVRHRSACERYGLSVDATVSDFLRSGKGTGPPAEVDREFGKFIRERGKGAQAREVGT